MEKRYTRDEALHECLDSINKNNKEYFQDLKEYNVYREYKRRYGQNTLGEVAINKILNKFGFIEHVSYTKRGV